MKRLLALLLTAATLLTVLGGCTVNLNPEITTKPSAKTSGMDTAAFDDATHDLALALTCGLRTATDPELVHSPTVVWNIIGWYCAIRANDGDDDVLSAEQVKALQYALRPEKPFLDIPVSLAETGNVLEKEVGGETVYSFPDYVDSYQAAFPDSYEIDVTDFSADTVKVTLTAKADGTAADYLFSFQKAREGSTLFPLSLSSVILPSSGKKSDAVLTYETLAAANTVTGLLRKYSTVGVSGKYADESTCQRYYFSKKGVIACVSKYTDSDGEKTYTGKYDNYFFYEEDGHCKASVFLAEENKNYAFDYDIASMLVPGTVYGLRETEENYTFFIRPDFGGADEDAEPVEEATLPESTQAEQTTAAPAEEADEETTEAIEESTEPEETTAEPEETTVPPTGYELSDEDVYYVVDKKTLALKKAVWNVGTNYEFSEELEYGCEVNEYQLTDHWEELREVTFVCTMADENGALSEEVLRFVVPGDMELIPYSFEELALYNNAENTEEYEYPGNGEDYIVYVTNVMG